MTIRPTGFHCIFGFHKINEYSTFLFNPESVMFHTSDEDAQELHSALMLIWKFYSARSSLHNTFYFILYTHHYLIWHNTNKVVLDTICESL